MDGAKVAPEEAVIDPVGKEPTPTSLSVSSPNKISNAKSTRNLGVIQKVKDPNVASKEKVDPSVDEWVKIKLLKWDKDQSGKFSVEEVDSAMAELAASENNLADLKWKFIYMFLFIFVALVIFTSCVAVGLALMKSYAVPDSAEMRAPTQKKVKTAQTELVVTSDSRGTMTLNNLLGFDNTTDQWLIDEAQLRELDVVSFTHVNGTYYHLEVAEVIRIDAGKNGTNDKLEIATPSGVRLRIWESIGDLEVLWKNATMWEGVPRNQTPGGRRLLTEEEELLRPHFAEEHHMMHRLEDHMEEEDIIMETSLDRLDPPSRRLGKGGVIFIGGGVGHGHRGHGSNGCNGWCSVPWSATESCTSYCGIGQCYSWSGDTYQCNFAARFGSWTWALHAAVAALLFMS